MIYQSVPLHLNWGRGFASYIEIYVCDLPLISVIVKRLLWRGRRDSTGKFRGGTRVILCPNSPVL